LSRDESPVYAPARSELKRLNGGRERTSFAIFIFTQEFA